MWHLVLGSRIRNHFACHHGATTGGATGSGKRKNVDTCGASTSPAKPD
jgi:hypothetical protein